MIGARNRWRWRCELIACSILFVNLTYELRFERRTGFMSYMPLMHSPPFTMSVGKPKSFCQLVTRATPQRCPPEELTADIEPVTITIKLVSISVDPGDTPAYLVGHNTEITASFFYCNEVKRNVVRAGINNY